MQPRPTSPAEKATAVLPFGGVARCSVRQLLPEDFDLQRRFFGALSKDALFWRFMGPKSEVQDALLRYLTATDGKNHVCFLVETVKDGEPTMIAEARYVVDANDTAVCEFAIAVADEWHGRGLARMLLDKIEQHAFRAGKLLMTADTLNTNAAMISLARTAGYRVSLNRQDPRTMRLAKPLAPAHHAANDAAPVELTTAA